jgi:hypothetical protein
MSNTGRNIVMKHKHFNPFTLSTYLSAERSTSTIMLPLVVCQECRRSLETLSEWLEALDHFDPLVGPEYATRYEHFFRLFRENDGHKERLEAIETDELYQHWGLTHLLIEESRNQTPSDPVHAKEFAELALRNAELLDPAFYHPKWIADLCAVASVTLAEAHFALEDVEGAKQHLRVATQWQINGTHRPRIARTIATLRVRILWELGQQDEEVNRLLDEVELSEAGDHPDDGNLLAWFYDRWQDRDYSGEFLGPNTAPTGHGG